MSCPCCRLPLTGAERHCPSCDLGLDWGPQGPAPRIPEIRPGGAHLSVSFAQMPLPGRPARDEMRPDAWQLQGFPQGVLATFFADATGAFTDFKGTWSDACVRTTFTPYDAGVRLGISARHAVIGGGQLYYSFNVTVPTGRAWLSRNVQWPDFASADAIGRTRDVPGGVPVGAEVTLEMRLSGPSLRAYVNGVCVIAEHDPTFGVGAFGIRCGREPNTPNPVRVLCHGYEVREVSP